MSLNAAAVHSLCRVFQQAFIVHDIAEPLVSCDDMALAEQVREYMEAHRFEIVGLRTGGRVAGYVEVSDLRAGQCANYIKPFEECQVILDSLPLRELVLRLREQRRLFVSILGSVGGIVSRTDLGKPPVRMWLFGMVTLIEMRFTRLIERFCPDESWKPLLSASRLEKTQ